MDDASSIKEAPKSEKKGSKPLCIICFENGHESVIMPCGHGGLCQKCSLDLFKHLKPCPVCREKIEMVCEIEVKSDKKVTEVVSIWEPENANYESDEEEEMNWQRIDSATSSNNNAISGTDSE